MSALFTLFQSTRRTLRMFLHEVWLVAANRRFVAALFGIPLAMTLLVNLALQDHGPPPDGLAIVDRDQSLVSHRLTNQALKWRGLSVATLETADPDAYVRNHPDTVILVLPAGLQGSVEAGRSLQLEVVANRATQSRAGMANLVAYNLGIEVEVLAGAAATARLDASRRGADENAAAASAVRTTQAGYNIHRARMTTSVVGAPQLPTFGTQARFATDEGISLVEFVGLMLAFAMVHDREGGRLTRLLWTRLRLSQLALAKGASIFFFTGLCLAAILAISIAFGMAPGPSIGALALISVAAAIAVTGYSMLILGIGHWAPHVVQLLGVVATVALSVFGGVIWPADSLPGLIRFVGTLTPNEWATEAYHALLLHGETGGAELWRPVIALAVLGVVQALVGTRLLVYAMRQSH
ncbi:MAG TPA: ABC transporter permease [Candidatus Dormibacteraeota bacterium]